MAGGTLEDSAHGAKLLQHRCSALIILPVTRRTRPGFLEMTLGNLANPSQEYDHYLNTPREGASSSAE